MFLIFLSFPFIFSHGYSLRVCDTSMLNQEAQFLERMGDGAQNVRQQFQKFRYCIQSDEEQFWGFLRKNSNDAIQSRCEIIVQQQEEFCRSLVDTVCKRFEDPEPWEYWIQWISWTTKQIKERSELLKACFGQKKQPESHWEKDAWYLSKFTVTNPPATVQQVEFKESQRSQEINFDPRPQSSPVSADFETSSSQVPAPPLPAQEDDFEPPRREPRRPNLRKMEYDWSLAPDRICSRHMSVIRQHLRKIVEKRPRFSVVEEKFPTCFQNFDYDFWHNIRLRQRDSFGGRCKAAVYQHNDRCQNLITDTCYLVDDPKPFSFRASYVMWLANNIAKNDVITAICEQRL